MCSLPFEILFGLVPVIFLRGEDGGKVYCMYVVLMIIL